MGIIYTVFTIWVIGMVIFWGGLIALRVLAEFIDACKTKEVYVRVEPTVRVYAKVEQDNSLWLRLEREEDEKAMDNLRYGDGE